MENFLPVEPFTPNPIMENAAVVTEPVDGGWSFTTIIIAIVVVLVILAIIIAIVVVIMNNNNNKHQPPPHHHDDPKCPKDPKCPHGPKPHHPKPDEPKPHHPKPKPDDPKPHHPKPKPGDPKPHNPKPGDPKPHHPKPHSNTDNTADVNATSHPAVVGQEGSPVPSVNQASDKYKLPDLTSKPVTDDDDGSLTSVSLIEHGNQPEAVIPVSLNNLPDVTGVQRSNTVATANFLKANMGKLDVPGVHSIEIPDDVSVGAMMEAFGVAKEKIEQKPVSNPAFVSNPTPITTTPTGVKTPIPVLVHAHVPVQAPLPVPVVAQVPVSQSTRPAARSDHQLRDHNVPVPVELPQLMVHNSAVLSSGPQVVPLPGNPDHMSSTSSIAESTGNSVTGINHTSIMPTIDLAALNQPVTMNLTHTASSLSD